MLRTSYTRVRPKALCICRGGGERAPGTKAARVVVSRVHKKRRLWCVCEWEERASLAIMSGHHRCTHQYRRHRAPLDQTGPRRSRRERVGRCYTQKNNGMIISMRDTPSASRQLSHLSRELSHPHSHADCAFSGLCISFRTELTQSASRSQCDHSLVGGTSVVSTAVKCRHPFHLPP